MKGFKIKDGSRLDLQDPVLAGRLDDSIAVRLKNRPWRWRLRLEKLKNGKVVDSGPWRKGPWGKAADTWAGTLQDAGIGTHWRIKGSVRTVMRINVVELSKGYLVLQVGLTEVGTKYVFGAANGPEDPGADAFDCSGFTQWAWQSVGVQLPHSAELQRTAPNVLNFTDQSKCEPGDLVFMWFPNSRGIPSYKASHVGLWHSWGKTLDTRNPYNSPVGVRDIAGVIGYGRPS